MWKDNRGDNSYEIEKRQNMTEKITCKECPFWENSNITDGFCSLYYTWDNHRGKLPFITTPDYSCGKTVEDVVIMRLHGVVKT